jgi:2-oxo-4-hydroxy-4-carboxy-5-ureidoimidazoline decarboxylase
MLTRVTSSSTFAPIALSLADFNELPRHDCLSLLRSLLDVESWATQLCDARPYVALDDLIATAATGGAAITPAEVLGALDRHPRIGARLSDGSRESAWSAREQAGIQGDETAAADLAAGNALYEARFGFIYLVRAAGRSARELLELLHRRLDNDRDDEIAVVRGELLAIAQLRIRALMVT